MYQIDNSTAATSQPASTVAGSAGFFTDGNPATATPATILPAEWLNSVMMELVNVITGAGLTPTKNQFNQVLSAIKRLGQATIILADTGAANAYTATNVQPLTSTTWVDGVVQQVKIAHANTAASTYAPDGLSAIPIYGLGLQPLQGGELALNGTAVLMHATIAGVNGGNPICVLMECAGGAQQVAPATKSQHAMQLGQATGRLLNVQVLTASGTYNATAGTNSAVIEVIGGGGGSGGTSATGPSTISVTGGGGAGAYARTRITTGFSGTAVTVGAGGTAGTAGAGNGGNGGTSSFGAFVSCVGGVGSIGRGAFPSGIAVGGGGAAAPVGANIVNSRGSDGAPGLTISSTDFISGVGANTPFGAGGTAVNATGAGNNGVSYGSGAGGACTGISTAAQAGGQGAPGVVIVYEYA